MSLLENLEIKKAQVSNKNIVNDHLNFSPSSIFNVLKAMRPDQY